MDQDPFRETGDLNTMLSSPHRAGWGFATVAIASLLSIVGWQIFPAVMLGGFGIGPLIRYPGALSLCAEGVGGLLVSSGKGLSGKAPSRIALLLLSFVPGCVGVMSLTRGMLANSGPAITNYFLSGQATATVAREGPVPAIAAISLLAGALGLVSSAFRRGGNGGLAIAGVIQAGIGLASSLNQLLGLDFFARIPGVPGTGISPLGDALTILWGFSALGFAWRQDQGEGGLVPAWSWLVGSILAGLLLVGANTTSRYDSPGSRAVPVIVGVLGTIALGALLLVFRRQQIQHLALVQAERELTLRNAELRATNAELRQSDRYKDEFLSVISHELRTPLNFIFGFTSILEDDVESPLNVRQRDWLRRIEEGADRMLRLVNDLLDLALIQSGKLLLERRLCNYDEVVSAAVHRLQPLAAPRNLRVVSEAMAPIAIDVGRIDQVLTHLLHNAIKFTPETGEIEVCVHARNGEILTEIKDSGIGIAPEDIPKLFARFRQLDMGSTRRAGGAGLGLSLCKGFVEGHGGQIGVQSVPGVGSDFWFTLPRGEPAEAPEL